MNQPSLHSEAPNIMVVDDVPENLKLMAEILKYSGYKVRPASSGALALDAARAMPPDLILLDINMPEMDGYEVCEHLKADEKLASIPVIFLSALNECANKVRGLRSGGIDYITKPFQAEEMLARINVHLELHRLRSELKLRNEVLDSKVRERTRELAEARDRLAILDKAKSDFLAVISHELRTPLNGVLGIAELIFDCCEQNKSMDKLLRHYRHSRHRLLSIVDDAMLLTQIGIQPSPVSIAPVSLHGALRQAIISAAEPVKMPGASFGTAPEFPRPIFADENLLAKALEALLETAGKFATPGSTVTFAGLDSEENATLEIRAMGHSIPEEAL